MTSAPDLRLLLPAVAAWLGALAGFGLAWWVWLVPLLGGAVLAGRWRSTVLAMVVTAAAACAGMAALRAAGHEHSLLAQAARQHAYVTLTMTVTSDPVPRHGRFGGYVVTRGWVTTLTWRGDQHDTHAPVLVVGRGSWQHVRLGASIRVSGPLSPPDSADLAGTLAAVRTPDVLAAPARPLEAASATRRSIREAVAGASPVARELVPGLVTGDDSGLPADVVDEFRVAGLTHLTAVSGTNLTLVVGFVLVIARWAGVRGRGLTVVGALGVGGFVLLARPEPSVLRAAVMGSVALLGMGSAGRGRGVRALSLAVFLLVVLDPWLARSVGFALSASATAGILFLAPPLRDALVRWAPRWLAEAVAVPFAAQVACTPLVAAISGAVSLVAVLANLAVAVVVGPATVLGLLGGLALPVSPWLGRSLGRLAGWCADWIVYVADRAAALPAGSFETATGPLALTALSLACAAVALGAPRFATSARRSLLAAALLVVLMIRPPETPGWPPEGWVMVACDVGQGDGLVLNAGPGTAVVVDTGPDPAAMDRCLRRLHVRRVPVVLITHFHADHIDGLSGVLKGRTAAELDVTALRDPPYGAAQVDRQARGLTVRVPPYGEVRTVGDVTWQVIGPVGAPPAGDGSAPNNASLVLVAVVRGVRILLCGDAEPAAQRRLQRSLGSLQVDVLKVPHHGSRYQDDDFLAGLAARLAVISVGEGNDYGHPSPQTVDLLQAAGLRVTRTDRDGDIAVIQGSDGKLRVETDR